MAALAKQLLWVRLLEISTANFRAWDLRGNCKYGNVRAVSFKQSIDKVQIAWTATTCADSERTSQMRLSTGSKSCGFFVPGVNPLDIATPAQCVSYSVEAITHHAIDSADAT
jgi:hypothetical protein